LKFEFCAEISFYLFIKQLKLKIAPKKLEVIKRENLFCDYQQTRLASCCHQIQQQQGDQIFAK
jgi:hypothetical protein